MNFSLPSGQKGGGVTWLYMVAKRSVDLILPFKQLFKPCFKFPAFLVFCIVNQLSSSLFPCIKFKLYNICCLLPFIHLLSSFQIFFLVSLLFYFFLSHCLYMFFSFWLWYWGIGRKQKNLICLNNLTLSFLSEIYIDILNWADLYSHFILNIWK